MKRSGESHDLSDFAGSNSVLESQLEEQPVARLETDERGQEHSVELACPKLRLGVVACGISKLGGIELLAEEIHESPAHPVCLVTLMSSTVPAPVPLADVVEA